MTEDTPKPIAPKPQNVGTTWSAEEEHRLYDGFDSPADVPSLASRHQRSAGAIRARLVRLGLIDEAGLTVSPKPPFLPSGQRAAHDRRAASHAPTRPAGDVEAQVMNLLRRLSGPRLRTALEVLHGLVMLEAADALQGGEPPRSFGDDVGSASGDPA